MQRWFNICKSLNVIQHFYRRKGKNHMIISTDAEKAYNKIHHPFMIKALMKLRIEGMCISTIKAIYDIPIASITPKEKKMKPFPPKSGMR
jgi:hypothetical protein